MTGAFAFDRNGTNRADSLPGMRKGRSLGTPFERTMKQDSAATRHGQESGPRSPTLADATHRVTARG
jgi:hypothetical protein